MIKDCVESTHVRSEATFVPSVIDVIEVCHRVMTPTCYCILRNA
jgi:hypothetical protein